MARKQPVAIVFDTFGTVVDWRGSLIADLTAFGKTRGIAADWPALMDKLVAEFGIKGLTEQDLVHINLGWHRLNGWPDSVPGLTRLKKQFVIGPLSNGNVSLLTYMAKHAGLPWDMIFGSDLFGHFKPDPETYLGVAKMMDLAPDQVMMAAAHNGDLGNARKCGLLTAFFPRPNEYGPHQKRDYSAERDWDIVAKDIEDLAEQLGV